MSDCRRTSDQGFAAAAGVPLACRRGGTVRRGIHHTMEVRLGMPIRMAEHWEINEGHVLLM